MNPRHLILTRRGALGLAGALALTVASACAIEPDKKPEPSPVDPVQPDPDSALMQTAADDPAAAAYQAGVAGAAFALLAAAIAESDGNAVISPLSISQCIALVGQGADGQTLQQIAEAFGCQDADQLRAGANAELTAISNLTEATFDMANTAFVDDSFEVKKAYAETVADWFGVAAHTTDFADAAHATEQINSWVAQRTSDKITELLEPGQVTVDTRTVLVNALYLNALWGKQFAPERTSDGAFTLDDGTDIITKFMGDTRSVPLLLGDDGAVLFELPYEDDDLQALFMMPAEGQDLATAVQALDPQELNITVEGLQSTTAQLRIPLFEVRQRLEVSGALQQLGIIDAFDAVLADFSALADEPTYVSFVQHEAWLKVAEKGTEGAAATAAANEASSAPGDQPPLVRLDRPFLFVVRVRSTGSIAFISAVQDPSQQ